MSVNLSVEAANTAPVAVDDGYSTPQDTVLNVAASGVLGNDTDADGDPLTAVLDTDVTSGTLTLNADGSFAYTPDAGSTGFDSFTYHANDGTADSNIVTVDLTVEAPNTAPVAVGRQLPHAAGHAAQRSRVGRPRQRHGRRRRPPDGRPRHGRHQRHAHAQRGRQLRLRPGRRLHRSRQLHLPRQRRHRRLEHRDGGPDGRRPSAPPSAAP